MSLVVNETNSKSKLCDPDIPEVAEPSPVNTILEEDVCSYPVSLI